MSEEELKDFTQKIDENYKKGLYNKNTSSEKK